MDNASNTTNINEQSLMENLILKCSKKLANSSPTKPKTWVKLIEIMTKYEENAYKAESGSNNTKC